MRCVCCAYPSKGIAPAEIKRERIAPFFHAQSGHDPMHAELLAVSEPLSGLFLTLALVIRKDARENFAPANHA